MDIEEVAGRELERLFGAVLDAVPDAVLVVGADARIRIVNVQVEHLFGYARDELVGQSVEVLVPSGLRDRHRAHRAEYAAHPRVRSMSAGAELLAVRKDGAEVPVEISLSPVEAGGELFTVASVRDVTARRLVSQDLRRARDEALAAEQGLLALLEALHVGVWFVDRSGTIVYGNKAGQDIWGGARFLGPEQFGEYKGWWYDSGEPISADQWAAARAIREGVTTLDELVRIACFDGAQKVILNSAIPLRDESGEVSGAIIVNHDVTAEVEARERLQDYAVELERSNRELDEFATVVAHDLREPLRVIGSYIGLLERRCGDGLDAQGRDFVRRAVVGVQRLDALINGLVAIARVGAQGGPRGPMALEPILEAAVQNLEALIRESAASITWDSLPEVMADESQIVQLLQNLLANAIRYRAEAPPAVHLRAEQRGEAWQICVADNGRGVAPEDQQRIFRMFGRAGGADEEGTGVGLAVCKRIVERHGGRIWVESEPGAGATFCFTLPAVPSAPR